jgi:hypothetical protein
MQVAQGLLSNMPGPRQKAREIFMGVLREPASDDDEFGFFVSDTWKPKF